MIPCRARTEAATAGILKRPGAAVRPLDLITVSKHPTGRSFSRAQGAGC